jgi:hypothetical protein
MFSRKPYEAKHRADGPSTMQLNAHRLRMQASKEAVVAPVIPGPDGATKPSEVTVQPSVRSDYVPLHQETPKSSTVTEDHPWPEERISYSVMDIPSNLW